MCVAGDSAVPTATSTRHGHVRPQALPSPPEPLDGAAGAFRTVSG